MVFQIFPSIATLGVNLIKQLTSCFFWRPVKPQLVSAWMVGGTLMLGLLTSPLSFTDALEKHAIPKPFRVVYRADYKGLPISATGIRAFSYVNTENDQRVYTLSSSALSIFAKLEEQSDFTLEAGNARPLFYRYDRTGLGKNKNTRLNFDWPNQLLIDPDTKETWPLTKALVSDRLLYQFQLQLDLLNAGPAIPVGTLRRYNVQDEGTVKSYEFKVLKETLLSTPLGDISTYEIIRSNDAPGRQTRLFLAPDLEFMLIRFEQTDADGEGFSLMLEEAFLEEVAVTAEQTAAP